MTQKYSWSNFKITHEQKDERDFIEAKSLPRIRPRELGEGKRGRWGKNG